jgi:dienelactone hydrolase
MSYTNLKRFEFWILLVCGLAWLNAGAGEGLLALLLVAIPGGTMLSAAIGFLFYPGDHGIARTGALGALIGAAFSVPVLLADPAMALGLAVASVAGFVACGLIGREVVPVPEDLDAPAATPRLGAEVAADEAVLGLTSITMGVFSDGGQTAVAREIHEALEWYEENGWTKKPTGFHESPPPLEDSDIDFEYRDVSGLPMEIMSFDSGFTARPEAPGGRRYMGYAPCRRGYAWVLRGDENAPWLVNVHGLTMGQPRLDLKLLQAELLHRSLGLNLVFPVLPLHGPRGLSKISGRGYLSGSAMDTVHAQTQALWDIRRIIGWLWGQGSDRIGLHGVSLGGFTIALVAGLEPGLRCAIAGIPASDAAWLVWWHSSQAVRRECLKAGIDRDVLGQAFRVIAPLAVDPQVPGSHRYIYAGLADRFVPPVLVDRLWRHWGQPSIHWYPGAHLSVLVHEGPRDYLRRAVEASLLDKAASPSASA